MAPPTRSAKQDFGPPLECPESRRRATRLAPQHRHSRHSIYGSTVSLLPDREAVAQANSTPRSGTLGRCDWTTVLDYRPYQPLVMTEDLAAWHYEVSRR